MYRQEAFIMENKVMVFSAPSGAGKTTIVTHLLKTFNKLEFSVSATSRAPRGQEVDGKDYYFLSVKEFKKRIKNGEFVEYEEVYTDKFYGTLKSQVDKQLASGENIIFDVDVNGAMNIKKLYGKRALSIFIQPPSIEELRDRLEKRATDAPEVIAQRVERAKYELEQAEHFDEVVINDNLEVAKVEARALVEDFLAD